MQPPPPPGPEPSANVGVRSRQTPLTPWILLRLIEKSQVPPPVSGPLVELRVAGRRRGDGGRGEEGGEEEAREGDAA